MERPCYGAADQQQIPVVEIELHQHDQHNQATFGCLRVTDLNVARMRRYHFAEEGVEPPDHLKYLPPQIAPFTPHSLICLDQPL